MESKISFIITIDTEGDNLWGRSERVTTKNAEYIPRFQELCEKYNFKPTYLTNYEMSNSTAFQEFGKDVLHKKTAEIGMHLHAWDMPPLFSLTPQDSKFHPYLIEYPQNIIKEKIKIMTDILEDTFQNKMVSHRAGRWSFNEIYAKYLIEFGYKVDCSVTPLVSWQEHLGDPDQKGGTDYRKFPSKPYFINTSDISLSGNSPLLELPMSIINPSPAYIKFLRSAFKNKALIQKIINHFYDEVIWLRPKINNLPQMKKILRQAVINEAPYVEFMLHSSELMPGGSPNFKTEKEIDKLYDSIEKLYHSASKHFEGCTMIEFYNKY